MEISKSFDNYMQENGYEAVFEAITNIIKTAPTWIKERYEKYQNQLDKQLEIINKNFTEMFEMTNSVEQKNNLMKEWKIECEMIYDKKILPLRLGLNVMAPLLPEVYFLLKRIMNKKYISGSVPTTELLKEGE